MVKFNLQVASFRRKFLVNHAVAEAVLLATFTAIIAYWNQFLRMDMTESLYILFRECEGGGDYDNLCQCVRNTNRFSALDETRKQDECSMADGELIVLGDTLPHHPRHHLIRMQGPRGNIRSFHGDRCNLRPICWNHRQGNLSVGRVRL